MRHYFFALLLSLISLNLFAFTQQPIHPKITLGLRNESIATALKKIEAQLPLRFFYRKADLKTLPNIDLATATRSLSETLNILFSNTFISFREMDGYIILEKNKTQIDFKIKGRVLNPDHRPMAGVRTSIYRLGEKTPLKTMLTDTTGHFLITVEEKGDYLFSATAIGIDSISMKLRLQDEQTIELPDLMLNNAPVQLKQVTVTSSRPVLERKPDRLIFNLEQSMSATGLDLTEALKITPLLKVDEGSVSIIGKGNVAVMINERIVQLSGTDLVNYLRSLRSDDVAKIEIITVPPAKYEAQGNGGMINIVLKKNQSLGFSGNISATYIQNKNTSGNDNVNLNYQSSVLGASLKLRHYRNKSQIEEENNIVGATSILSKDPRRGLSKGLGANLSIDQKIGKNANIGFIYDIGETSYNVDIDNTTTYLTGSTVDSVLSTMTHNRNPIFSQTLNLYYDQKFGEKGKKLSMGLNYFGNEPETDNDLQTYSDQTQTFQTTRTYSGLAYQVLSAQADLTLPLSWAKLETGAKYARFDNNSDIRYYRLYAKDYMIDPSRSNIFEYGEQNMAGYISLQKEFNKRWSAQVGLRYENAKVEGYSPSTGNRNQSNYGRFFPTAYLTYKPAVKHVLSLSYSRRINRPNIRSLNPFRIYANPYSYSTGNPLLQPSYNHNIEFTYLYREHLYFAFYGNKLVNGYGYVTEVDGANRITDAKNYLTMYGSGLTVTFNKKFFKWWEHSIYAVVSYFDANSALPQVLTQSGSNFNYGTNNTFSLSSSVKMFVNFTHSLPAKQGNGYRNGQYNFRPGVRWNTLSDKLQLSASGYFGAIDRVKLYFRDFTQAYWTDYNYRTFNLNATYIFGRSKVKGNTKRVDFRETQRAN